MWEILLLDFFNVGDSAAGLFSSWTKEQASPSYRELIYACRRESLKTSETIDSLKFLGNLYIY
jgi:hypothetical protein